MQQQSAPLGALAARAHDLLALAQHPLQPDALIEQVFAPGSAVSGGKKGALTDFWRGQLARVLADSATFTQYDDGGWGLVAWGTEETPLESMVYVVVDCETTGLDPNAQRVIEIAALRCRGPRVLERFETLIDPGRSIPFAIQRLTGITPALLEGAPAAPEAIAAFVQFAGGDLLVGHNVRFDLNFLGAETQRHLRARLLNPSLCTIRLARLLLPHLRRLSLDNLAQALDLTTRDRHRAMGDAEVTQLAFWRLAELARKRDITTRGRLLALTVPAGTPGRASGGQSVGRTLLDPALRRDLPEKPGVYLMKDERGAVIYVGKAKNIKQRILSHFSTSNYRRRKDGLLESVRALETIVVGSELEALIKESQLIKALQPRYNKMELYYRHYPFIKVDVSSPFPRVWPAREVRDDGARYFGPFRSQQAVEAVVDLVQRFFPIRTCTRTIAPDGKHRGKAGPCLRFHIGRCLGPCMGAVTSTAYRDVVEDVLDFLGNGQEAMLARVEEEMGKAARMLDFERAAVLRDALRHTRRLLLSQQLLAGAVEQNNVVIVCAAVKAGGAELFAIRHGRFFEQCSLPDVADPGAAGVVEEFLDRLETAAAAPPVVGREEIDAIIIIGRWLARYGESRSVIRLPATPEAGTAAAIVAEARTVHLLPAHEMTVEWDDEETES